MHQDATTHEINTALENAWQAFHQYRNYSLQQRAAFMRAIAAHLEAAGRELIDTAFAETHLDKTRLAGEKARTVFQLNSYADACAQGNWLEARINTADTSRKPARPDLRKMLVPLGPVVVFGASNFPFAYSTAGGDTACAFAAGCPVIVKAHPAHANTSALVAEIIVKAARQCNMPPGIFAHLYGAGFQVGEALVKHPYTKAVGFTGSYTGGMQLYDWGRQRNEPIPVFAEMGSTNPVFLLPEKLAEDPIAIAGMLAASVTLSAGQFCTNPGILIGIAGPALKQLSTALGNDIQQVAPAAMLHPGIARAFAERSKNALTQQGVSIVAQSALPATENSGAAVIATVPAKAFMENALLQEEVFGPYSLLVQCSDINEMKAVARQLPGQLTCTVMATENELAQQNELLEVIKNSCGRLIFNGVPTGVEVCLAMQHGGPFPATTDCRFTAVGADGIKRFARPVAYQNWANGLLPPELKNENPLGIYRTVNNELTKEKI